MTASLEERLLPILVMLFASMISAIIPLYALGRRRLNLQRDIIFILFWFQSWVYLHLIPTLNCMFPTGEFAFPPHLAGFRLVQFTTEQVDLYAALQAAFVLLFYFPMAYAYCRYISKENIQSQFASVISFTRLMALAIAYLIFGIVYFSVALRTGLINAYTMNMDVIMGMGRFDRFIWKFYYLSGSFLMCIVFLAFLEYRSRSFIKRLLLFIVISAAIACTLSAYMISSRGAILSAVLGIVMTAVLRGHIRRIGLRQFTIGSLIVIFGAYACMTIPKLRGIVLDPDVTSADIVKALNPFERVHIVAPDFGLRLDGVELMVLATPALLNQGTVPLSWYMVSLISPVLPLFPEWERELKFEQDIADFKFRYLSSHTPVTTRDYGAVSLTELFMILGPAGFLIAGLFFGWALRKISSLIRLGGTRTLIGVYFLFCMFSFEASMAGTWTGWIRACPVLAVALILNPWRLLVQRRSVPSKSLVL